MKNWLPLILSKLFLKLKKIVHNHTNCLNGNPIQNKIEKKICNYFSDLKVACSYEAGDTLFDKKISK